MPALPRVLALPADVGMRHARLPLALLCTLLGTLLATACAGPEALGTTSVVIDGTTWRVLRAGPDGMRGRPDFEGADGMLFDLGGTTDPSAVQFVTDGVAMDLDIAWFAADGSLVGTRSMPACVAAPCPRYAAPGSFRWAIEATPGAFDHLGADARLYLEPPQGP